MSQSCSCGFFFFQIQASHDLCVLLLHAALRLLIASCLQSVPDTRHEIAMELQKLKAQLEPLIAQKQEVDKNAHRWGCSWYILLPLDQLLPAKLSVALMLSGCAIRTTSRCHSRIMRRGQQES